MKRKINYFLFNSGKDIVLITQDGNVGSTYNNGNHLLEECYSDVINKTTKFSTIWEELGEGRLYATEWDGESNELKTEPDDEVIQSMLFYFYDSIHYDFVKNEMGKFTNKKFNNLKLNLKLKDANI